MYMNLVINSRTNSDEDDENFIVFSSQSETDRIIKNADLEIVTFLMIRVNIFSNCSDTLNLSI